MKWWRRVKAGEDIPPPSETEIFKTETYSSFIFLFFKIATEINVFSHLRKMLLLYMKESLLGDRKDLTEENESEDEEEFESDEEVEEISIEENHDQDTEIHEPDIESKPGDISISIIEEILDKTFTCIRDKEPKTVTSLYGKVYVLEPSIKALL